MKFEYSADWRGRSEREFDRFHWLKEKVQKLIYKYFVNKTQYIIYRHQWNHGKCHKK